MRFRALERFDLVAEHGLGGVGDPLLEFFESFPCDFLGSLCFWDESALHELRDGIEGRFNLGFPCLPNRIVELLGQQRLGGLGGLHDLLGLLQHVLQVLALFVEFLDELLLLVVLSQ